MVILLTHHRHSFYDWPIQKYRMSKRKPRTKEENEFAAELVENAWKKMRANIDDEMTGIIGEGCISQMAYGIREGFFGDDNNYEEHQQQPKEPAKRPQSLLNEQFSFDSMPQSRQERIELDQESSDEEHSSPRAPNSAPIQHSTPQFTPQGIQRPILQPIPQMTPQPRLTQDPQISTLPRSDQIAPPTLPPALSRITTQFTPPPSHIPPPPIIQIIPKNGKSDSSSVFKPKRKTPTCKHCNRPKTKKYHGPPIPNCKPESEVVSDGDGKEGEATEDRGNPENDEDSSEDGLEEHRRLTEQRSRASPHEIAERRKQHEQIRQALSHSSPQTIRNNFEISTTQRGRGSTRGRGTQRPREEGSRRNEEHPRKKTSQQPTRNIVRDEEEEE